jgi:hypothetical protein
MEKQKKQSTSSYAITNKITIHRSAGVALHYSDSWKKKRITRSESATAEIQFLIMHQLCDLYIVEPKTESAN